jgi:hypothetical protein
MTLLRTGTDVFQLPAGFQSDMHGYDVMVLKYESRIKQI